MTTKKHMSEVPMIQRVAAYLAILVGYFFYCYNFVIIDYVRPYIVEAYDGISLSDTAQFYTWQSVGALIGALSCAWFAGRFGKKYTLITITALNGGATIVNMMFTDYATWAAMRFIIGLSLGGYFTVAVSLMIGLFTPTVRGKLTAFASSMFSVALMVMGAYAAFISSIDAPWESLMWVGGIPPLAAAFAMVFVLPSDKNVIAYGEEDSSANTGQNTLAKKGSWGEMLSKPYRLLTITCLLLAGLNFYGFQFFSGFVTTYLKEVRQFDGATIGVIFSISAFGSLFGAWVWGAVADKFGRKVNAFGFILAGIMAFIFFIAPSDLMIGSLNMLAILGLIYNFGLSSSAVWGGYFSELFPAHLRSYGAALFHGGRIIGMWAPMVLIFIKERTDLQTAMWGSPIVWIVAGLLWLSLPETLKGGLFDKRKSNQPANA
ncbi:sugar transporter family protein [Vibrio cholerae]|uniref:MFS transporter n=1 Tax=Vibrio cholerae TaxID=666 RepID=UPI0006636D8B|nr:MFS transporter [Vibrio cholerae]OEC25062.1 MFS transporter [Vibrio cholerae]OFI95627.1 MFS transporter [Vibrio cholerae]CSD92642.1 sugar transporter family protein [Vibrio cholerae]CSE21174.1 sugar transporter family protein [Vibrio cholerae]GHW86307.1 sugar transporter family protein [Vibrio cholerae]